MNTINTGGPAFPCMPPQDAGTGSAPGYPFPDQGMTLRDYFAAHSDIHLDFAAKVASYLLGKSVADISVNEILEVRANLRFIEADAMLAASEKDGAA